MTSQKQFSANNIPMDVIILAAGKGTRMPSARPKALQTLLGTPMISHVYNAVLGINPQGQKDNNSLLLDDISTVSAQNSIRLNNIWTVVGHKADEITAHLCSEYGEEKRAFSVLQEEQLGTGHAVLCVLNTLKTMLQKKININKTLKKPSKILVLNADTPLISTPVLENFINQSQNIPLAFMSLILDEPTAYGRVLRSNFSQNLQTLLKENTYDKHTMRSANSGSVSRIIEAKDFKKEFEQEKTQAEIYEVNAGIYLFDYQLLEELLPQISTTNLSGEYYLTDIVSLAHTKGYAVDAFNVSVNSEITNPPTSNVISTALLGVNNPYELVEAETHMHKQEIARRLRDGIVIHSPDTVRISPEAIIEKGVEIFGPCEIYKKCFIGENTRIESHSYIENTHISAHCHVRSFCHFVNAHLGERISIGPYARLRPEAKLGDDVHIGNFVEIKKSTVDKGCKVNHLTYIGDSEIGSGVNVGAGCITCNYDGVHKHKTTIHDNAFLGSNCAFIAPVTIGKNALIGAGSVITKNVPENTLALTRPQQVTLKK